MSLERRLAETLLRGHPERAAVELERLGAGETTRLLATTGDDLAAAVLSRLSLPFAGHCLSRLGPERAAEVLGALALDVAARLARRLPDEMQGDALERVPESRRRALRSLLRFPENTAGAMMDPDVLALPQTFTASEALARVKRNPESARYTLYVVDGSQKLVGAIDLRGLLIAPATARIADLMVRSPAHLEARDDRSRIVGHPGWREARALPVVDEQGCYLGVVRYRTLRELEEELLRGRLEDTDAPRALGQLFAAGVGGLLDALRAPPEARRRES